MHMKPSVICIICTPLNTFSAGSIPGFSRQGKGKIKKIYGANAPQLHHISLGRLDMHPAFLYTQAQGRIGTADHPPRAYNEVYQTPSVIRRRRTIDWRSADLSANSPSIHS